MFTDSVFGLTFVDPIFGYYKKADMEYVLGYPKSEESWYRMLFEWIETWWMKRTLRKFEENDLLIE
jgi:hypothetical protein